MSDERMTRDQEHELRAFIAVCEACQRSRDPSHSWHVVDWMSIKLRRRYPLVRNSDRIIDLDCAGI